MRFAKILMACLITMFVHMASIHSENITMGDDEIMDAVAYFQNEQNNKIMANNFSVFMVKKHGGINSEIGYLLGMIPHYFANKNYDACLKQADLLINTYKKRRDGHFIKGYVYETQQKYQEAIAEFDLCLDYDLNYWNAFVRRAYNYLQVDETEKALRDYESARVIYKAEKKKVMASEKQIALNLYFKGLILKSLSRYDEALACFDDCINAFSKYLNKNRVCKAYCQKSEIYMVLHDKENAKKMFIKAQNKDGNSDDVARLK